MKSVGGGVTWSVWDGDPLILSQNSEGDYQNCTPTPSPSINNECFLNVFDWQKWRFEGVEYVLKPQIIVRVRWFLFLCLSYFEAVNHDTWWSVHFPNINQKWCFAIVGQSPWRKNTVIITLSLYQGFYCHNASYETFMGWIQRLW